MRTGSVPAGKSLICELSQWIGDGPWKMSPCLPPLNALQSVSHALQNLGPFLLSVVLIWHSAGKGTLRHLRLHKVAHCKVTNYILESAFASLLRSEDWKWLLSQCSYQKRLGSSGGSVLKCVDSQGVSYFSFIPQPWEINHDIITSWHHPHFTTEGHWAIYPQRRRTTAKKPLLSARLVATSDSHEKAEGRQLLMLDFAGGCPFSDGKCCSELTMPLVTSSVMFIGLPVTSEWPVNPGTFSGHRGLWPVLILLPSSSEKSKFHSGSLGFPFCLFFFFFF